MRTTRNYRPPFDATAEFVWLREVRIDGIRVHAGDPVDRRGLDDRRLRQLYEVRSVGYAPGCAPVPAAVRPPAVGPSETYADRADEVRPPVRTRAVRRRVRAA